MNPKTLQPRPLFKDPEEARKFGRRGGQTRSLAKRRAAQLRELKKRGRTDEQAARLYELMTDKNAVDREIVECVDVILSKARTARQRVDATKLLIEFRKVKFGTKIEQTLDVTTREYKFTVNFVPRQDIPAEKTDGKPEGDA